MLIKHLPIINLMSNSDTLKPQLWAQKFPLVCFMFVQFGFKIILVFMTQASLWLVNKNKNRRNQEKMKLIVCEFERMKAINKVIIFNSKH